MQKTKSTKRKRILRKMSKIMFRRKKKRTKEQFEFEQQQNFETCTKSSMPMEIDVSPNCEGGSVYSAVSGASGLPDPKGRSMMTSILPDLLTDTESETSIVSPTNRDLFSFHTSENQSHNNYKESFLANTKSFKDLVDWAFDTMDTGKTGSIDKKEFYSGILLIHIHLAKYAGIAACKPPSCDDVYSIFEESDVDSIGTLDKKTFADVTTTLSSRILARVAMQWLMLLVIIPIISRCLLGTDLWSNQIKYGFLFA